MRRGSGACSKKESACVRSAARKTSSISPSAIRRWSRRRAGSRPCGAWRMRPGAGFPAVRQATARRRAERTGLGLTEDDVLMKVGAPGATNTLLKAILDPGDEVIVLNPYFPEYRFYIENHAGRVVPVETDERFQPDVGRIAAAITPRT